MKTTEEIGGGLESREGEQKCQMPQSNFTLHGASLPGCQYSAGKLWLSQTLLRNAENKVTVSKCRVETTELFYFFLKCSNSF